MITSPGSRCATDSMCPERLSGKAIEQFKKKKGYEIEAVRNRGYRLLESPDIMSEAEIRSLMDTEWAGKNIVYFDEIDSTNNRAKELGEKDGAHGTLFCGRSSGGWKREKRPCVGIPKMESAFI